MLCICIITPRHMYLLPCCQFHQSSYCDTVYTIFLRLTHRSSLGLGSEGTDLIVYTISGMKLEI